MVGVMGGLSFRLLGMVQVFQFVWFWVPVVAILVSVTVEWQRQIKGCSGYYEWRAVVARVQSKYAGSAGGRVGRPKISDIMPFGAPPLRGAGSPPPPPSLRDGAKRPFGVPR